MPPATSGESPTPVGVHPVATLRGRGLQLARVTWLAVAAAGLGLWAAGLLEMLPGDERYYMPGMAETLAALGLAGRPVALALIVLLLLPPMLTFVGTALVLFLRRPGDPMALFVSFALLTAGTLVQRPATVLHETHPAARPPVVAGWVAAAASLLLLPFLFPDGRFVPRWTRWLAGPAVGVAALLALPGVGAAVFSGSRLPAGVPAWQATLPVGAFVGVVLAGVGAQVYRYRRISGPVERQQAKWVATSLATLLLWGLFLLLIPALFWSPPALWIGTLYLLTVVPATLVPISFAYAILRYRLFDIDVLIRRTLLYGALTASLATLYWLGVVALQRVVGWLTGRGESAVAVVASTLAIAALFQPLRRRLQAFIDRRFYRRKYDAQRTLAAFAATLRDETDLGRIRADLLATVQETMQPAHAALWLRPPKRTGGRAAEPGPTMPPDAP